MKNKNIIKSFAVTTLLLTCLSVGYNFVGTQRTDAQEFGGAKVEDENTIADFTIGKTSGGGVVLVGEGEDVITSMRNDSDLEGNQIYVWAEPVTIDSACTLLSTVKYQLFNRAGIPLSQPITVDEACAVDVLFSTPDVTFTAYGFAITYTRFSITGGSITDVMLAQYLQDGQLSFGPSPVNDTNDLNLPNPKITADQHGGGASVIGITWNKCRDIGCTDQDVVFQDYNSSGVRVSPANIRLNDDITPGHSTGKPNVTFGSSQFMVTWSEFNGVVARGIDGTGSSALTNILNISGGQTNAIQPDITGVHIEPDLRFVNMAEPFNFTAKFFIAYSAHEDSDNSQDIFIRKIACDNTFDPNTFSITYNCAPTTRNNNDIVVRTSSSSNEDINPTIAAFQNYHDIKRFAPYENSSINYLTVGWTSKETSGDNNLIIQSYTDTLKKAGNSIIVDSNINEDIGYSISSNQNGNAAINYSVTTGGDCPPLELCPPPSTVSHGKIYPSKYLRIGQERIVNAPDYNEQSTPQVAVNSNGNYAIVYTSNNGTDNDVIYALFDYRGNPIKNTSFASQTTGNDQSNPHIEFYKNDANSPDFGKFIISWDGEGNGDDFGVYYRVFNADGSPSTNETLVNDNVLATQYGSDLGVGKNNQIAISYLESGVPNSVRLAYLDGGNIIRTTIATDSNPFNSSFIALSPTADGTFDFAGNSKFAIGWSVGNEGKIAEGYLHDSTTVNMSASTTVGRAILDMDGGYKSEFGTDLTVASDEFFYAYSTYNNDGNPAVDAKIFNSTYSTEVPFNSNGMVTVSVDPATGNIMTIGNKDSSYQNFWDRYGVLLSSADSPGEYWDGQHIANQEQTDEADVTENFGTHAFIENFTNNFGAPFGSEALGDFDTIYPFNILSAQQLSFGSDITGHFTIDQIVTGGSSGASGAVKVITPFYIVVEPGGTPFINGDQLDNGPFNDTVDSVTNGNNFYFSYGEGDYFNIGDTIFNGTNVGTAEVVYPSFDLVFGKTISGSFSSGDNIEYFTQYGYNFADIIQYPSVTISQVIINSSPGPITQPFWVQAGPSFGSNHYYDYGQAQTSAVIDYNTTSADSERQLAVAVYANNSHSGTTHYLDTNGIYQQIFENPFNIGQGQDLSPTTEQQVNPGGKYIIVPQTIDFGNVSRNSTASVNFSDLTPNCLTVTDLDGTDFDLTVSLTDLVDINNITQTIPNSNFVIENNDSLNPLITSNYSFSNTTDVSLEPSTGVGQNADLGSTKTLLSKSNNNTGSWTICPKAYLTIPNNVSSGTFSGTITFTLI